MRLQPAGEQLARRFGLVHLGIERRLIFARIQNCSDTINQLRGGVAGVGDGQDFVGAGGFALDEVSNAPRQHRGLAGPGAGDHQHRTMDVLDSLTLLVGGYEMGMAVARHWASMQTKKKRRHYII